MGLVWPLQRPSGSEGIGYGLKGFAVRLVFQNDANLVLVLPEPAPGLMVVIASTGNYHTQASLNKIRERYIFNFVWDCLRNLFFNGAWFVAFLFFYFKEIISLFF